MASCLGHILFYKTLHPWSSVNGPTDKSCRTLFCGCLDLHDLFKKTEDSRETDLEMNVINNANTKVSGSEDRNLEAKSYSRSSQELFEKDSVVPNELTTLLDKSEGAAEQCQENRVINGVWHIPQEEKDARTFILEYDISNVGRNNENLFYDIRNLAICYYEIPG